MTDDAKTHLHRYLQTGRDGLLWKIDGLGEYDARRPLTPTGTNLLGIVKHVASVAAGYFGACFDRPFDRPLPWLDDDAEPNADMWATPDETREDIIGLYHAVWAHTDATIDALELDTVGHVPWWPEERRHPTLHLVLVHMIAETHRHAGHADILRETLDHQAGRHQGDRSLPEYDARWWSDYRAKLEAAAKTAAGLSD